MLPRESLAVGGASVRPSRPRAAEVSFDLDAPSNSSLVFEPADTMTFTLLHATPSKTFQLLSVVNIHPTHTTLFSVKTLKPERYFIKPSKVMLGPREHIVVRIELRQALYDEVLVHFSQDRKVVADRLLIQSAFNTNPVHDSTFQAAYVFKNEPKSKAKDAAWAAAWKTFPSTHIHAKNLVMQFEASPDFGKVPFRPTIDSTSTPFALGGTSINRRTEAAVSDLPPLFTTHESMYSIEEAGYDFPIPMQQTPRHPRRSHLTPASKPVVLYDPTRRSSVVGFQREKADLSLALTPSSESLVFAVSPHKSTSHSIMTIENLAPTQRVCFAVRIESKFRCKALPYRVGYIDGAGTASVQLELALSLHQDILHLLGRAEEIDPFKVRVQVMEMDAAAAAATAALPTDDARAQFLKALWQSPPNRMFVQKYTAVFVLDVMTPPPPVTEMPDSKEQHAKQEEGEEDGEDRLSVVSECASYATAFTRAPPMRPIMTPLEHLQYQRTLNRHLLSQNDGDTVPPMRPTILELTEADEQYAQSKWQQHRQQEEDEPEAELTPGLDKKRSLPTLAEPQDPPVIPPIESVVHDPAEVVPPTIEHNTTTSHIPSNAVAALTSPDKEEEKKEVANVVVMPEEKVADSPVAYDEPTGTFYIVPAPPSTSPLAASSLTSEPAAVAVVTSPVAASPPTSQPVAVAVVTSPMATSPSTSKPEAAVVTSPVATSPPASEPEAVAVVTSPVATSPPTSEPAAVAVVTSPMAASSPTSKPAAAVVTSPVAASLPTSKPTAAVVTSPVAASPPTSEPAAVAVVTTSVAASPPTSKPEAAVVTSPVAASPPTFEPEAAVVTSPVQQIIVTRSAPTASSTPPPVATIVPRTTARSSIASSYLAAVSSSISSSSSLSSTRMSSEPPTTTTNPPSVHVVPATSVVGPGADVTSPSDQVGGVSTAPSSVSDVAVAGDATLLSSRSLEQLSSRSLVLSEGSQDDSTFHTLRPSVSMDPDTLLVEAAMASLDPIIESHEGHSFVEQPHVSPVCRQSSISNAHSNYGSSGDYDGSYDEVHEAPQYEQLEAEHADTSSLDDDSSEAHDDFHGHKDMCHPQVHDQKWTPRPSTIDDIPSGFSILTFPSEPPPVITTPPGKAAPMDCWEYDTEQQQQAVVEPSSPPDSLHDRVSINNLTLPAPLVHGVMTRSPEPSPPPPTSSTTPKSKSRFSLLKAFERNHGPSKPVGLVTLTPQTILYHMDVGSAPSGSVTLTNLTSSVVVYKVKSAHPLRYKVKPTQGFLEPKGHCVVTIDLHPTAYNDLLCLSNMELGDIRDCLLVEAATSPTSRTSKALRNAKTHGELLGLMRTLWDEVNKKDVNVSRLFCEYAFDDSAYQSFVATLDGPVVVDGPVSPAVDEPRTPPAIIKKGNGFGWPRSKTPTNKVLRNAL